MAQKMIKEKANIINKIITEISKKLPAKQAETCSKFIEQFYGTVALEDLETHSIDDLYGAALSFWNLFSKRKPGETKIHIYNPDYEKHGWQSTHTIIEIIQDDMPFLVDSVRMEMNRQGFTTHLMVHMGGLKVCRDAKHQVTEILPKGSRSKKEATNEAPLLVEIDRQTNPEVLQELRESLERIFGDVRSAVVDWEAMRNSVKDAITELESVADYLEPDELAESKDFLRWIEDHHFTFLGVRDYELVSEGNDKVLKVIPGTGLGVLSDSSTSRVSRSLASMTPEARKLTLSSQILIISKTNTKSSVHRPIYTDYIGIKRFDKEGKVIGERRVIGLYTSAAYNTNPKHIPFLRRKVANVLQGSQLSPKSHAWKVLTNILETLPRDDLFQSNAEELLEMVIGIFHLQERRRIRMFARKDVYGRFISCLVYVPRERFNTELLEDMKEELHIAFGALEVTFSTRFTDSVLARVHFVIRIDSNNIVEYDFKEIEKRLIEIGRSWQDELSTIVLENYGEEQGNRLINRYKHAFPSSYREYFPARSALYDIKNIEPLSKTKHLEMNFYRPVDSASGSFRFKIYQNDQTIPLSDVLPILENMGLRVISERPYEIKFKDGSCVWINDFGMEYDEQNQLDIEDVKDNFQQAFEKIWYELAESDGFNKLILGAGLNWREVAMLRAYAKYLRQTGFTFSQDYIEETFASYSDLVKLLVQIFNLRFSPSRPNDADQQLEHLEEQFIKGMDDVANLDEDRILRRYLDVIHATLRTNYFQLDEDKAPKRYMSFKFDSAAIPDLPLPLPMFEIFVYSPRFEGVHLRGAKVARGGLRWSDRREDFRTEILGLMKAQKVKNAVIVPSGAKGGFVPKHMPTSGRREDIMNEGVACYQNFIRGLLDITDNMVNGEVVRPTDVVSYDDEDPYLVVAADKGTATFSDIANEISNDYNFWLGDAFASGGSAGYDHKKMGITARGAWESVKRHFRELGHNCQTTDFTVVGIGDMSGDVFGNGMLLSRHIRLVAAFNHMHIFLDPSPDSEISFKERERLFNLPRSSWTDYNEKLISQGGGVFSRAAKSIKLSPQVKKMLGLKQDFIVPSELLQAILRAKVDLLWNGGIGTYVKATRETHTDVGDRSNDAIRINADELRCKVVGEGGNLGFTQLARVQYAVNGGMVYTDFIDNSAGVDCSDHEVNIKILLNDVVVNGDMTEKQRNKLLAQMTDEVAALVLAHNYHQTQAISLAATQAVKNLELHSRYIEELEHNGKLERALESLPDEKALTERKLAGKGLARPGIAVLLAYSKTITKEELLESDVPEDPYLSKVLGQAFPKPLREKYREQMEQHSLRREIIATQLSNTMVNEMGFTFIYRLSDETGAPTAAVVRAYAVAREVFGLRELWKDIESLDNKINANVQIDMLMQIIRLIRRATRWFLRNRRKHLDIATAVDYYSPGVKTLKKCIPEVLDEKELEAFNTEMQKYIDVGVDKPIAKNLAAVRELSSALDIIEAAHEIEADITDVAKIYFAIGEHLDLGWIRSLIIAHSVENHWEALSREALRDDLDWQQRLLSVSVLSSEFRDPSIEKSLEAWMQNYQDLIDRWQLMLAELRSSAVMNYTMYFVAVRELLDLTQTSFQRSVTDANNKPKGGKKGQGDRAA